MAKKVYVLKVSLDKEVFRTIEIQDNQTLYDLARIILKLFGFDMDHAFGFYSNYKNVYKSEEAYELFADLPDSEPSNHALGVQETAIQEVFKVKKKMAFLFDYGDEWIFLIECKDILDPAPKTKYPRISEKVGQSPEQYPDGEEG